MKNGKEQFALAIILFICSAFVGSFGPPVFKHVMKNHAMNQWSIVMYFLLIGGLACIPFSIKGLKQNRISTMFSNKRIAGRIILIGALMPVTYICYTHALIYRTATETVPIVRLDALFVVILSAIFLKEKVKSWSKLLFSILICMVGLGIFVEISLETIISDITEPFVLFAVVAALSLAIQATTQRYLQDKDKIKDEVIVCITMIIGGLCALVIMLITDHKIVIPNGTQFFWIVFLGVVTIFLGIFLQLKAYDKAKSVGKVYLLSFLRPIFVAIISYYLLGECGFSYINLAIGMFLIFTGVYIASNSIEKREMK